MVVRVGIHRLIVVRAARPVIQPGGIDQVNAHAMIGTITQAYAPGKRVDLGNQYRVRDTVAHVRKSR
ncbi:hypothetical protein D3C76_1789790 [compost metagenome]